MNNRQSRGTYERNELSIEDFISDTNLTAPVRFESQVETAARALVAENRDAGQAGE